MPVAKQFRFSELSTAPLLVDALYRGERRATWAMIHSLPSSAVGIVEGFAFSGVLLHSQSASVCFTAT